jgi:hypothetical protein
MFERFCIILKALETACEQLMMLEGASSPIITEPFVTTIRTITTAPDESFFVIDKTIIKRAKVMLDFVNMNKLLLAKYTMSTSVSYDDNLQKLLTDYQLKSASTITFGGATEEQCKHMRRIMLCKENRIIPSKISHGNFHTSLIEEVMITLAQYDLGTFVTEIPNNHIPCKCFYKVSIEDITSKPHIGKAIQDLGLTIESVVDVIRNGLVAGNDHPNKSKY